MLMENMSVVLFSNTICHAIHFYLGCKSGCCRQFLLLFLFHESAAESSGHELNPHHIIDGVSVFSAAVDLQYNDAGRD